MRFIVKLSDGSEYVALRLGVDNEYRFQNNIDLSSDDYYPANDPTLKWSDLDRFAFVKSLSAEQILRRFSKTKDPNIIDLKTATFEMQA